MNEIFLQRAVAYTYFSTFSLLNKVNKKVLQENLASEIPAARLASLFQLCVHLAFLERCRVGGLFCFFGIVFRVEVLIAAQRCKRCDAKSSAADRCVAMTDTSRSWSRAHHRRRLFHAATARAGFSCGAKCRVCLARKFCDFKCRVRVGDHKTKPHLACCCASDTWLC